MTEIKKYLVLEDDHTYTKDGSASKESQRSKVEAVASFDELRDAAVYIETERAKSSWRVLYLTKTLAWRTEYTEVNDVEDNAS